MARRNNPLLLMCIIVMVGMAIFSNCSSNNPRAGDKPQPPRCDERHRCASGCCSREGVCRVGPEYCNAETCIDCSTRPRRQCDRGYSALKRLTGYYELWNGGRSCNRFSGWNIPIGTYEHINIAFLTINPNTFELNPIYSKQARDLRAAPWWRRYSETAKVYITVSSLSAHDWGINNASCSLTSFLSTYDLDGVDINWEQPDGTTDDYENLLQLLKNIRYALSTTAGRYDLTMTLPVSLSDLHNYNLRKIVRHIDYFNLMPLDLHSQLAKVDTWKAATLGPAVNTTQVSDALDLLWRHFIDPSRVNFGTALYGSSLIPKDPACIQPGCPVASGAAPGFSSHRVGMLMNSEIQDLLQPGEHEAWHGTGSTWFDSDAGVNIGISEKQWIAYDDMETLRLKLSLASEWCFGGVTAWAITHDTRWADYAKILDCLLVDRSKPLIVDNCRDIRI
ncbi:glycoside hydrolase superfamily [Aspergillus bertholletiae]|uniref:chitinase n=1 Tax=Aspergillus bertholletiae TaxID=1226010 RepID=A0A5N7B8I7_9EURO|nr:glycoside hydrolase superfamily [Aspergillus bertholletiae]